jgi:uncharacterized delta-60 repeat protein
MGGPDDSSACNSARTRTQRDCCLRDLDPSFGTGGKVLTDIAPNGIVQALALQPDDKILAVGSAPGFCGENRFALARYNPAGNLDTTFGNVAS